jgi:hypothetical protein
MTRTISLVSSSEETLQRGIERSLAEVACEHVPACRVHALFYEPNGLALELLLALPQNARTGEERIGQGATDQMKAA